MVLPYVAVGKALQESLMTDTCTIMRNGSVVATDVRCRFHSFRLFTETPDPTDANTRSMSEWGWTLPLGTDVAIGDTIFNADVSTIAGEVLHKFDTWGMAIRVQATMPKDAIADTAITLYRFNDDTEVWDDIGDYMVAIHYDRNLPTETPPRFAPAGTALYKGGTVVGDLDFVPKNGDRFTLINDAGEKLPCVVQFLLPGQPQRHEARFEIDVAGPRM